MKDKGYKDIRKNQQQVDASGKRVGRNRPDVQGTNPDTGQREYVEINSTKQNEALHEATIMRNDPNGLYRAVNLYK